MSGRKQPMLVNQGRAPWCQPGCWCSNDPILGRRRVVWKRWSSARATLKEFRKALFDMGLRSTQHALKVEKLDEPAVVSIDHLANDSAALEHQIIFSNNQCIQNPTPICTSPHWYHTSTWTFTSPGKKSTICDVLCRLKPYLAGMTKIELRQWPSLEKNHTKTAFKHIFFSLV